MRSEEPSSLEELEAGLRRAEAERDAPPASGEVKQVLPLAAYLDERAESARWRVVSELRDTNRTLYNSFGNERFLAETINDLVAQIEGKATWAILVRELERFVYEGSEWLITIPLANASAKDYSRITDRVGLAEVQQAEDWERDSQPPVDRMTIFAHLEDHIGLGARWHRPDSHAGRLDGRRTAELVMVERGAEPVALSVARTKARYALAMWCLLAPPEWHQLWPSLAEWEPRPHIERGIGRKPYERGAWTGGSLVHGRHINHYQEWEIPRKPDFLRAPFAAMERAVENGLAARAALSAAWSLFVSERSPSDLERTDRLMHVLAAIEALCDLGEGPTGRGAARWERLTQRLKVWREIEPAYSAQEITDAKSLTRDLRNVATHGSDDTLVNLGYPPELIRLLPGHRHRSGEELSLTQTASVLPVIATAAQIAAKRVALQGIESGWNDDTFRANFS
jgi:hypothetical protein